MFNRIITDPEQVPVPQIERKSTDIICTFIGAIFALVLFIVAVINFSSTTARNVYFNFSDAQSAAFAITRQDSSGFHLTIWLTIAIGISLGLLWLALVHLVPAYAPLIAHVLAIIAFLVIGFLLIFVVDNILFSQHPWLKIFIIVASFLLALILIASLALYYPQLRFQGIMLKYGVRYLNEQPINFLWLVFFLLLVAGLIVLFLFQHVCFTNISYSSNNFWNFANPGVWGILNIIEFLWGLQFLRDAFTYILAGNAIDWYWSTNEHHSNSFHRLICNNWGSVVAGSFLNAFFIIPSLIAQLFICHPTGGCGKCGNICYNSCNAFTSFFGLIRTDSYSYMNLFGNPYCDSSRESQKLCSDSLHFQGFQSPQRNYRIISNTALVTVGIILSYLILRVQVNYAVFWFAVDLIIALIASTCLFASLHASVAQGIQTSFLVEHYLSSGYDYMQHCIYSFRKELQTLARRDVQEGRV